MNRITKIEITLQQDNSWLVAVTKEFEPKYGGGSQVFTLTAPNALIASETGRFFNDSRNILQIA